MMHASQQYLTDALGDDTDILIQTWFESDEYNWHRFNYKYGSVSGRVLTEAEHKQCHDLLIAIVTKGDTTHLAEIAGPEVQVG